MMKSFLSFLDNRWRRGSRVKVPTKPLGFLASSVVERDPARPEAHRSTVGTTPLVPKDKAV